MRELKKFENQMEQLSNNFDDKILKLSSDQEHAPHGIKIYSFAERLKYNEVLVVPLASVTKLAGHSMIVRANHVDICKPATKGDQGYQKLLEILEMILLPDSNYHMSTSAMKQSAGSTAAKSSLKSENLSGTIPASAFHQLIHYISNKQHSASKTQDKQAIPTITVKN
jgi:hypothetical protein